MSRKVLIPLIAAALASSALAGYSGQFHGGHSAFAQGVNHRPDIQLVPLSRGSLQNVHEQAVSRLNREGYRTLGTRQEGPRKLYTRLRGARGGAEVVTLQAGRVYKVIVRHF